MTNAAQAGSLTLGGDLEVNRLGFGAMRITGDGIWGPPPDRERALAVVRRAVELGVDFIDTADSYGPEVSERIIAETLHPYPSHLVIATKGGLLRPGPGRWTPDCRPERLREACEASLRRLNTDVIDLYQLHVWDYPLEKVPAMVDLLESLVQEGKIRFYGWSTDDPQRARIFAQGQHCTAIQHRLNVLFDAPEMLALCEELDLASVNRSALARGALSGKYTKDTVFPQNDVRKDPWSHDRFFAPTLSQLDSIREILTSSGRTLVQGALAAAGLVAHEHVAAEVVLAGDAVAVLEIYPLDLWAQPLPAEARLEVVERGPFDGPVFVRLNQGGRQHALSMRVAAEVQVKEAGTR